MTAPGRRYIGATAIAVVLAIYATAFARQTHDLLDWPTFIDVTEWPATLLFLFAAWQAWTERPRRAALALVIGMFAFMAAQHGYLFRVPMGFVLVTVLTLAFLVMMPASLRGK